MDTLVRKLIAGEYKRQQDELEMIASENYVSKQVMEAYANVFTNKYAEGYPGKRYYGGQQRVDKLERLCQWRALRMFDLIKGDEPDTSNDEGEQQCKQLLKDASWGVNVQPLSGSPANLAVYLGVLQPGDTILAMDLSAGGHLTHGHPLNASGAYYTIIPYGVDEQSHRIDMDVVRSLALEHAPQLILVGFSAYPRTIDWEGFGALVDAVEEAHGYRPILMADVAHIAGLIAGGASPSPFGVCDIVTTTTHKTLRGPRGGLIYARQGKLTRNHQEIDLMKSVNRGLFPGMQGGPHEHIIASKCVAFKEIITGDFAAYAQQVVTNAQQLARGLHEKGWSLVSDGTDNHLILLDVTKKSGFTTDATGKIAEHVLEQIGISVNKNMIPFDPRSPLDPSGIRLGTPAITTRGLGTTQMDELADIIDLALTHHSDENVLTSLRERVLQICEQFPLRY